MPKLKFRWTRRLTEVVLVLKEFKREFRGDCSHPVVIEFFEPDYESLCQYIDYLHVSEMVSWIPVMRCCCVCGHYELADKFVALGNIKPHGLIFIHESIEYFYRDPFDGQPVKKPSPEDNRLVAYMYKLKNGAE